MLSILIPTYNYDITDLAKVLHEQIQDINYSVEVLFLDDFSSASHLSKANHTVCEAYGFSYKTNNKNVGRTATRQQLALMASHELLLYLDADVIPQNKNFLKVFEVPSQTHDLTFGGIAYDQHPPTKDRILRWIYGKKRETRGLPERLKVPYLSIISGCFLVKKKVFIMHNPSNDNCYGHDVIFTYQLRKTKVSVKHIDNPVIHKGLETNLEFISKTLNGLDNLYKFEKEELIPDDFRPIQKTSKWLRENGLNGLFAAFMKPLEKIILKNLNSGRPSLFLFDMYRLYYYNQLHQYHTKH